MKSSASKVKGRKPSDFSHPVAQVLSSEAIYKSFPHPVLDYPYSMDDWSIIVAHFKLKIQRLKNHEGNLQRQGTQMQLRLMQCKIREPIG